MKRAMDGAAVLVLLTGIVLAGSAQMAPPAQAPNPAFEKLKSLAGRWEGTYGEKKEPTAVSYSVVSNGTAVEETIHSADSSDMVTMYVRDGDRLVMTHYCSMGNQPRMVSKGLKNGNELEFVFQDITNLADPKDGHMRGMVLKFVDNDHITHSWTWREGGKDAKPEVFEVTRKK